MSLLDICSNNSYWRGLDYFENNKVKSIKKINDNEYEAIVLGSKEYNVHLNILHPKKSTCTCPHATGKSIICKHKVAVFFALFPDEVQKAIDIRNEYYIEQEEKEKYLDEIMDKKEKEIRKYVYSLSDEDVREKLIARLLYDEYSLYLDEEDDDFFDYY